MSDDDRCKHFHPRQGTPAFEQGQKQANINLERFHYLRAAILGKYEFKYEISPIGPRQGLDFSVYDDFLLAPFTGIKLHPRPDGTILPEDLEVYHEVFTNDWNASEAGLLYFIGDPRAFFNIILNYHSRSRTTGNREWDALFAKLKANGFPKSAIPCMFFVRPSGCLDSACPFQHDVDAAHAMRERILDKRRECMRKPTPKKTMQHMARIQTKYRQAHGLDLFVDLPEAAFDELKRPESLYCANPECSFSWELASEGDSPLKRCSQCRWTYYCCTACQKADWRRHKKEPCAPLEEIVHNDSLWSRIGSRKGTEAINIDWGDD